MILLLLIDFFQIITSLREIKNQSSLKTMPKRKKLSLNQFILDFLQKLTTKHQNKNLIRKFFENNKEKKMNNFF